jgi:hypothetical protein
MKRVLIVTPNWPPVTYPDLQRSRMALPYLQEFGWQPLILRCDPHEQEGFKEEALCQTIPPGTPTWEAGAVPRALTSPFGLRQLGWRSMPYLNRLGRRIIEQEKPDLAFFSTTMFPVMTLGPSWAAEYGLPYVLDFQDPWVPDQIHGAPVHPGLKASLARSLDRCLEPRAIKEVSHIISVSPAYVETLSKRYPSLRQEQFTVLPFGAPEADFELLTRMPLKQDVFDPNDGYRHWVYAGRGGNDLEFALRGLFLALADARRKAPVTWNRLRLHFLGTHYHEKPGTKPRHVIEHLAEECGVGGLVEEKTERIGYLASLKCLLDAEAVVVPGSIDRSYTASKIYPYILAKKPLLAIFHEESSICDVLRRTRAGTLIKFSSSDKPESVASRISREWFEQWPVAAPATDWKAFSNYSAHEMTRQLCAVFDQAVRRKPSR